jgi:hypothetical protein
LQGEVEAQYLYATILSRQLLPFGFTGLSLVVLPLELSPAGNRLIKKETALGKGHWGLHNWLSQAEDVWKERKKIGTGANVYQWLDYMRKLTSQHLTGYYTLLYNTSGTNIAAAVLSQGASLDLTGLSISGFVADADTYIYQATREGEIHYLCAFLNSGYVDQAIKPYQTRGAWGERHIHRRPFEVVPIPRFDPEDESHQKLVELSQAGHKKVAGLALEGKAIGRLRGQVRQALKTELDEIDRLVKQILSAYP